MVAVGEPTGLSPREREVLLLRTREDLVPSQIAQRLGISVGTAEIHLRAAKRKLGNVKLVSGRVAKKSRAPGAGSVKEAMLNPHVLSPKASQEISAAMEAATPALVLKNLSAAQAAISHMLTNKGLLARASAPQLGRLLKDVTEVSQVMRGEPTQIVQIQDIRKRDEIGRLLLAEARRRGIVVEGRAAVAPVPADA